MATRAKNELIFKQYLLLNPPPSPGISLGQILGRVLAPSYFKNEQKKKKIQKQVYIIPNFLALLFDERFMEIRT